VNDKSSGDVMDISEPHVKIPLIVCAVTVVICWLITNGGRTATLVSAPSAVHATAVPSVDAASETQSQRIKELEKKVVLLQVHASRETNKWKAAEFDPADEGFQRIDSNVASFAVSIGNLQPYGDGSKLTVKIGNPSAATFSNAKLHVKYGPRYPEIENPKFAEKFAEVDSKVRTKEIALIKEIVGASWNPNQIILPGVKPDTLGYVQIRIETDFIHLNQN
jgi:hypothetical protein